MDETTLSLAAGLVPELYIKQGIAAIKSRRKLVKTLLSQRRMPDEGWDEGSIEYLLQEAAMMDSNNFLDNVGVGEREARIACPLVERRHYHMAHGVGRSGDIAAVQPKAAGSSLLARLTTLLVTDALSIAGLADISRASVLPLATGMAITSVLLSLKKVRPPSAQHVLWPRIDQKTCAKCVVAAGLNLVVIPMRLQGDQLCTDVDALEAKVKELGAEDIVAVLSTTSCFAPRAADDVVAIAKLCQQHDIGHVINNAYGVQAKALCSSITAAWRRGRVDAVVQSTDKNFMVPVGGSVVAAGPGKGEFIDAVNAAYPGRASAAPMVDLLMTLLFWGRSGWKRALEGREFLYHQCKTHLEEFAASKNGRLLDTPGNPISLALTLEGSNQQCEESADRPEGSDMPDTRIGSMLFHRCVSGTRVVARGVQQKVAGHSFRGYGAHCDCYPHTYLTFAAALGTSISDVKQFTLRLEKVLADFQKQQAKAQS